MSVTPPPHNHSFGTTWVTDANNHWKECECEEKSELGAHVDDNGDNKCDTCDYTMPAHDPDGLGTGAIIGIVVASVAAVVAAVAVVGGGGFAIFRFVIKKKRR